MKYSFKIITPEDKDASLNPFFECSFEVENENNAKLIREIIDENIGKLLNIPPFTSYSTTDLELK